METDILTNKKHYNYLYKKIQVQDIVDKARSFDVFLDDAIQTDTSWHGLYYGDFRNQLMGKRVLELGSGNGLNAVIMALLGADVIANDISDVSGNIINEVNSQIGTSVLALTGDFSYMEFEPKSFDYIVGKAFLHHLTHELESEYLSKAAKLLKRDGEARFFESAVNNIVLDYIRWLIPVPGRPSMLNIKAFQEWKDNDPHPERDNSSKHFQQICKLYFNEVTIVPIGSVERLCRLLPRGNFNRKFRRWAHRTEPLLPNWFRFLAARSQLMLLSSPII